MFLIRLSNIIKQKKLFEKKDRILVGVSGGADSLALLDALSQLAEEFSWQIAAAHLNHMFRGKEAEEDAEFVQQFCAERGIPCKIGEVDVPRIIKETQQNPQLAAREARFLFFKEVADEWNMNKLALGHHANDQAETVLMRILRGTGMEGISGIPYVRDLENSCTIVRPFLAFFKEELEEYCRHQGIVPRLDSSNLKTYYRRNFLRLKVIPFLEETVNPSVQTALIQLGEIASVENEFLDQISKDKLKEIIKTKQENKIVIKGKLFLASHPALQRRMIKLIFSYLASKRENIGFVHIDQVCDWIRDGRTSSKLELPNGVDVFKEYNEIVFSGSFSKEYKEPEPYLHIVNVPGITYVNEIKTWITTSIGEKSTATDSQYTAVFDYDELVGQLSVRSRLPGDRMSLFGMGGSKKVKDVLIDTKVPRALRNTLPIITDEKKILWIPGIRRSNEAIIKPETKCVLTIQLNMNE